MGEHLERGLLALADQEQDLKARVWTETKIIWRIAFPSMLALVTSYGMVVVTQAFLGHIGEVELATYALIQSVFFRFIGGILLGMASATDTLCGQAFGARQYHMMGIYLQQSWIIDGLIATISLPLFFFTTPIFKWLRQKEEIAEEADTISLWFIPIVYCVVFLYTMQMYLQAQLKNLVIGCLSAASFVLHLLLSWIFVYKLKWGVAGAMASLNICDWSLIIGQFVYIFGGWCSNTWKGFSKAAFYGLWPMVKLSFASGFMLCLEFWYPAILVLMAGYMKNATVSIDAFSICINVNALQFMVCLGFFSATIVRVANELGRENAKAVKFSIKTIMTTSICFGLLSFIFCLVFDHGISSLFTISEQVAEAISSLSTLLAFSMLLNSIQLVLTGVAVGAGFQSMAAFVNFGCYYVMGLPVGAVLAYVLHLEVTGLWIGMLAGVVLQCSILAFIVWRTDWDELIKKTSTRLNRLLVKLEDEDEDDQSVSQA